MIAPIAAPCSCEMCRPTTAADVDRSQEHPLVPLGRELARRLSYAEDYEGAALVARLVDVARVAGLLQYDNRTAARTLHALLPSDLRMHGSPPVRDIADKVAESVRR